MATVCDTRDDVCSRFSDNPALLPFSLYQRTAVIHLPLHDIEGQGLPAGVIIDTLQVNLRFSLPDVIGIADHLEIPAIYKGL